MITFNKENHEYRGEDGLLIPSVTQVLQSAGLSDFSKINNEVLDTACQRGSVVHKITELHDRGVLDPKTVHPELEGYFEAYKSFLAMYRIKKFFEIEKMVYHPQWKYVGTLDRIAEIEAMVFLYDIKTGVPSISHDIQDSAYMDAYNVTCKKPQNMIDKAGTLYLEESGKFKFVIMKEPVFVNFTIFKSALTIHNFKLKTRK